MKKHVIHYIFAKHNHDPAESYINNVILACVNPAITLFFHGKPLVFVFFIPNESVTILLNFSHSKIFQSLVSIVTAFPTKSCTVLLMITA